MNTTTQAEYIFEASWEVCNKIGGIYTVLSTRAASLQKTHKDKVIFFGPDVWGDVKNPYFIENSYMFLNPWKKAAANEGLNIRVGRWNVPGKPLAVLIDFSKFWEQKDEIYARYWDKFGVNSIAAYGDYDESSIFGYATGVVMESFYRYFKLSSKNPTVAHFNEWMTSFGLFYIKDKLPQVATLFTTHATSIGRSIAGNNKPLYDHLHNYDGDQMAQELNMVSKHSTEKQAAHYADCFTTVSEITDAECEQLLEKKADIVTPNGFEAGFVPRGQGYIDARSYARTQLKKTTETILGTTIENENALFIATSGRYEYKNKGIDVFIASLKGLAEKHIDKDVYAFIIVPAHISGCRQDLKEALKNPNQLADPWNKHTTHELVDYANDSVMSAIQWYDLKNEQYNNVKVIFVPAYITENDEIFKCSYYDLLIGFDLTVFPSYYEPWGYTPLESVAFQIPTITTSLSGFGQWASKYSTDVMDGVGVIRRSDYNTDEVIAQLTDSMVRYAKADKKEQEQARKSAANIAKNALWKNFIQYYYDAYKIALTNNK